jgi:hypothetical protein
MRLGDFLTLSDLGLDGEFKVEFYDMGNFKEDILANKFSNLYMIGSEVEDKTHAPYGLLVDGSSLVVFFQ